MPWTTFYRNKKKEERPVSEDYRGRLVKGTFVFFVVVEMGGGSSKHDNSEQVAASSSTVRPGQSVDSRVNKPNPASTDIAVIKFSTNTLTVEIFWYFHEDGFTIPSPVPHSSIRLLQNYSAGQKRENRSFLIEKQALCEIADACKGTNRTFLIADVLSLTGQILLDFVFQQPWFHKHPENVLVFCSPTVGLPKDSDTHPLLFGNGHAFYPTLASLGRLVTKFKKKKTCKSKIVFVPRHLLCKRGNFFFRKLLPDIIEQIVELDESKMGRRVVKKNAAVRSSKKKKTKKAKKKTEHENNLEHGISTMEDVDGIDMGDFALQDDGTGHEDQHTKGHVHDISDMSGEHTMHDDWNEEIDFDAGGGLSSYTNEEFEFDKDDNVADKVSKTSPPASTEQVDASAHSSAAHGKRLMSTSNDSCFHMVGNGQNVMNYFSNCFDSVIVEKCYFHLEAEAPNPKLNSKQVKKLETKREDGLVKDFALLSDMFESTWKGDTSTDFPERGPDDDFSNDYYESMPRNDYSLWPNGSLVVASLGERGHEVAKVLKMKDTNARANTVYTRGNRVDSAFKSHQEGFNSIFLIVDIVSDAENFKNFLEKDRKGLPLTVVGILPGDQDGTEKWAQVADFLCAELTEADMTIFIQAPGGVVSSHTYWFLLNIINCPTCLSTVAKHMNPFKEVHHAVGFVAMSGIGFMPLTSVSLSADEREDLNLSVYASWCIFRGQGGLGDGFDGKDEMESQQGIEKAVMDFTQARTPLSPFVSATASTVELHKSYKGGHVWSLIAICPQKFVNIIVKALSAADEIWNDEGKNQKIETLSRVINTYRDLAKESSAPNDEE